MTREITVPRWGITMEEGRIGRWLVQKGDAIMEGQAVCEVETEKIVQTVDSLWSGIVVEILCQEGDAVAVGKPILLLEEK